MVDETEPGVVRIDDTPVEGAATLMFNRPHVRNAVRPEDLMLLNKYLMDCQFDPKVRVIILTGSEGAFCAGADLKAVNASLGKRGYSSSELSGDMLQRIVSMSKIVIAAVNGPAAGLGHHISTVCDLTVVRADASFHYTGPRKGIPSLQFGALVLPMLVGLKRAKEILIRGGVVTPERAVELGLANEVVAVKDWDGHLAELASEFAQFHPEVMALDKYQVNQLAYGMLGALRLSSLAGASRLNSMEPVITGRLDSEEQR